MIRAATTVALALATLATGCAGGHARLSFDSAAYPVSLSPTVPDNDGQILAPERFEVVGVLSVQTKAWAIFYSAVPLQGKRDVSSDINAQVAEHGGEGVVNLRIVSKQCKINHAWVINALPIWPGCSDVTLTGDIIRRAAPSPAPAFEGDDVAPAPEAEQGTLTAWN